MVEEGHDHDEIGLTALRQVLATASREARSARAQLEDTTGTFRSVSQQVINVVGGSAQGIDRELVESLERAIRQVGTAIAALGLAGSTSDRFS